MRISDLSTDVCSSVLHGQPPCVLFLNLCGRLCNDGLRFAARLGERRLLDRLGFGRPRLGGLRLRQIGRDLRLAALDHTADLRQHGPCYPETEVATNPPQPKQQTGSRSCTVKED